jgi:anion-transporting  ArsA/GET3 family ATPase
VVVSLFERRLVIVTGKGGAGKTTVAAAIGLAAAQRGRRTLLVEVASQHRLARLFGEEPEGFEEVPLYPGLSGVSIDPQKALEEYLTRTFRIRALAERLVEGKAFGYVAAAAPGLREMVTIGKVYLLTREQTRDGGPRHELVVLDAPATGHGIGMLRAPRTFQELVRVGRLHEEARAVAELLADPSLTAIVLVTTPEEMPVSETIEAAARLRALELDAPLVVVNALYPDLFAGADETALRKLSTRADTPGAAARAALSHIARRGDQDAERQRLAQALDAPRVDLPFLFTPTIDVEALLLLAEPLGPPLEAIP